MARKQTKRAILPVVLGETLDLSAAAPLAADLLARRGQDLSIDAGSVQRMGGQCLQVLLSARSTWLTEGRSFRVVAASSEFSDATALLGATDLAMPAAEPAASASAVAEVTAHETSASEPVFAEAVTLEPTEGSADAADLATLIADSATREPIPQETAQ